jgi:hypothetical protein
MQRPPDLPPIVPGDPLAGFRDRDRAEGFTPEDPRDQEALEYVKDWIEDTSDD